MTARLPVSAYTPGQAIDMEIDVDNRSRVESVISVQLLKVTKPIKLPCEMSNLAVFSIKAHQLLDIRRRSEDIPANRVDMRET